MHDLESGIQDIPTSVVNPAHYLNHKAACLRLPVRVRTQTGALTGRLRTPQLNAVPCPSEFNGAKQSKALSPAG